ncbi:MAG: GNAT family N-acetyltransferase [Clostridiales bacterium]|nr:GNAT family N-acetyltransferase [Clostridiales bacterium]
MSDTLKVEVASSKKDIEIVESLAKEIWEQHYLPIIGQAQVEYMLNKYQSVDAISQSIKKGYVYYIAYYEDKPCGYSAIMQDEGIFLSKFYVKNALRGKGLGKEMLNTIYEFTAEHNLNRIWLTCNKYNLKSLNIYNKLGFEIVSEIVTDIGNGYVMDDYILEKYLSVNL